MTKVSASYLHLGLFLIILFCISWFYGYGDILNWSPRSTHEWRQTDSASIAYNYYADGMDFFRPRFHYQFDNDGYTAPVGETAVPYYIIAALYYLTGPAPATFRLFNFLFFVLGLYALSRLCLEAYDALAYALVVPFLLLSSGLLAFYSFNFVPNTPALGMAWVGWYAVWKGYRQNSLPWFIAAILAFVGAALFKIPGLLSFLVLPGIWVLSLFIKEEEHSFLTRYKWQIPLLLVLPLVLVFGWIQWASYFNEVHQSNYFLSSSKPYWETSEDIRGYILHRTITEWGKATYPKLMWYLMILLSIGILLRPKQMGWKLYVSFLALLFGCFAFFILWYGQFLHHDYYLIEMMVLPAFILILFPSAFPRVAKSPIFIALLIGIAGWNMSKAKGVLDFRYAPSSIFMSYTHPSFFEEDALQQHLQQIGIQPQDLVVSVPDGSPNGSLYHLKRKGWTELYLNQPIPASSIDHFKAKGASYLVVSDTAYLSKPHLQPFFTKPLPEFKGIHFFDLTEGE